MTLVIQAFGVLRGTVFDAVQAYCMGHFGLCRSLLVSARDELNTLIKLIPDK